MIFHYNVEEVAAAKTEAVTSVAGSAGNSSRKRSQDTSQYDYTVHLLDVCKFIYVTMHS